MLVIVCGMPRSGSTVRYQIACALAERFNQSGGHLVDARLGWNWDTVDPSMASSEQAMRVVKVHEPCESIESRLDPSCVVYLYSYRDIRDAVVSLLEHEGLSQDLRSDDLDVTRARVLARMPIWLRADAHFRSCARVLTSRYEDAASDLAPEIRRYAEFLGVRLDDAVCDELSRDLAPDHQRRIADDDQLVAQGEWDDRTLLHPKHIGDGAIGKYRTRLDPTLLAKLEAFVGDWLTSNGYTVGCGSSAA